MDRPTPSQSGVHLSPPHRLTILGMRLQYPYMMIPMTSDKELDVDVHLTFRLLDGQLVQWSTHARLHGAGECQVAVTGRCLQDVVGMELEYNGRRFAHPIESDDGVNMKSIRISGGRDQWSQLLREAAMKSARTGTTPSDYDDD